MAAERPDRVALLGGLTEDEIDQFVDCMVSKLAFAFIHTDHTSLPERDPRKLNRDEIKLVVVDTMMLVTAEDPVAELDRWMEAA